MSELDAYRAVEKLVETIDKQSAEVKRVNAMLTAFGDAAPNLFWAKDLEHRYIHCNIPHAKWLGVDKPSDVYGFTDVDMALRSRALNPNDNTFHTFGEMCKWGDEITVEQQKHIVFLEDGNVRGKYCALRVCKAVLRNDEGDVIGTVGSGYDLTERLLLSTKHLELMMAFRDDLEHLGDDILFAKFEKLFDDFVSFADRHRFYNKAEYHG